jgi:hypothetical protein
MRVRLVPSDPAAQLTQTPLVAFPAAGIELIWVFVRLFAVAGVVTLSGSSVTISEPTAISDAEFVNLTDCIPCRGHLRA